jgi:hypothetical protein
MAETNTPVVKDPTEEKPKEVRDWEISSSEKYKPLQNGS